MKKDELAKLLAAKTEEFQTYGGEVVRYASPENPNKIKPTPPPLVPKRGENQREEEWENYLKELYSGTYAPDTDFRLPEPKPKKPKLPKREDGRGWKNLKGPNWKDEKL